LDLNNVADFYNEFVIINFIYCGERVMLMFEVDFYEDRHGNQPVKEVLIKLRGKALTGKDARIQYQKVLTYIRLLEAYGTRIGEPQVKHIDGSLWELRPLAHRILFFHWRDNRFILLHHFIKKTQKAPPEEIERAKQYLKDYLERND
jgi:phage-related protein